MFLKQESARSLRGFVKSTLPFSQREALKIHKARLDTSSDIVQSLYSTESFDGRLETKASNRSKSSIGVRLIASKFRFPFKQNGDISETLCAGRSTDFIDVKVFFNLCNDAVPSNQNGSCTKNVWTTYLSCLQLIPSTPFTETDILHDHITQDNVFGMAVCSALSIKTTRKVEYWISLQDLEDVSTPNL